MPRRKIHPLGATKRICPICKFMTVPLTNAEWEAKRHIHETSVRHLCALRQNSQVKP
jgi:hypothetical protein